MGNINNWTAFLATVDPATQTVAPPFANPYMPNPTEVDTTGATVGLKPSDWATAECAQYVADTLGGVVTTVPPAWAPQMLGVTFNQPKYYVTLTGPGTMNSPSDAPFLADGTTDPALLMNMFPGYLPDIQQALPKFLGIVAGG